MGFDPVTIGLGTTLLGAATGGAQAFAQNSAVSSSQQSLRNAGAEQMAQLRAQASQQRQARVREFARAQGKIRVASSEAGTGFGGSFLALTRQNAIDTRRDINTINTNLGNNTARVESGVAADNARLEASTLNPLVSILMGGITGVQTGLSIFGAGQSLQGVQRERDELARAQEIVI